jgi:hypothetical protein
VSNKKNVKKIVKPLKTLESGHIGLHARKYVDTCVQTSKKTPSSPPNNKRGGAKVTSPLFDTRLAAFDVEGTSLNAGKEAGQIHQAISSLLAPLASREELLLDGKQVSVTTGVGCQYWGVTARQLQWHRRITQKST